MATKKDGIKEIIFDADLIHKKFRELCPHSDLEAYTFNVSPKEGGIQLEGVFKMGQYGGIPSKLLEHKNSGEIVNAATHELIFGLYTRVTKSVLLDLCGQAGDVPEIQGCKTITCPYLPKGHVIISMADLCRFKGKLYMR